jgi:hypothetical protein
MTLAVASPSGLLLSSLLAFVRDKCRQRGTMLAKLGNQTLLSLQGPALFEPTGLPRYWSAVWSAPLPGSLAHSTLKKRLASVERLYTFTDDLLGIGGLDRAIAATDVTIIGQVLEAYFLSLRNHPGPSAVSEDSWQIPVRFLREVLTRIARSAPYSARGGDFDLRLLSFEDLHGNLRVSKHRRPERVRSLPADVIEALYQLLDPAAPGNPFREGTSRWRAYVIFILLLHQGLRRGELLCLSADGIRSSFDKRIQRERFWLTVRLPTTYSPVLRRRPILESEGVSELSA